ncbi:MAG: LuxR C-terminal-related transcriptional regulator [Leptolyngbyaceae cyanobacterium HOT.MB2.61]|nr:LuxR C-terminal-related transcriptional regulator [Leptolyngbyaceae cyanobacterium HOT.MB2.61]
MLTQSDRFQFLSTEKNTLLQGVIESLLDGILILTSQGKQIYINDAARRICQRLDPGQMTGIPREIWRACEALIESLGLYSNRSVVIESEIALSKSDLFRIRVRWLPLEDAHHPHLVVLMEDCCQSLQSRAIAEVQQYSLTPRQAEVWILHRIGYSYQDIAKELYISLNTVKKHIKDIHVKRYPRETTVSHIHYRRSELKPSH